MALNDLKILESEKATVAVQSVEGSRLVGTVEQNKEVFDKFPQLIMDKFNALITWLNEQGLDTIADDIKNRYIKEETNLLVDDATGSLVADISANPETGVITITKKDGSSETIDIGLTATLTAADEAKTAASEAKAVADEVKAIAGGDVATKQYVQEYVDSIMTVDEETEV